MGANPEPYILPFSLRHSVYVNPILNAYLKKLFLPASLFYPDK